MAAEGQQLRRTFPFLEATEMTDERVEGLLIEKWPSAQFFLDILLQSGYVVEKTTDGGLTVRRDPDDGKVATAILSLGGPDDPTGYYLLVSPFVGDAVRSRLGDPSPTDVLRVIEGR